MRPPPDAWWRRRSTPASPPSTPPTPTSGGATEEMLVPPPEGAPGRRHPRLQGGHAAPGPRPALAAVPARGCATAWRAASAGWAWTASTCSTCTSRTGPRPLQDTLRHRGRARRRGQDRRAGRVQLRGLADRRRHPRGPRGGCTAAGRGAAALQPGGPAGGGGIPRIRRHAQRPHHGLQPARRRPADRQAQLRSQALRGPLRRLQARRHVHPALLGQAAVRRRRRPWPASPTTPESPSPSCRCAGSPTGTASAPCCWAAPRWSSSSANIAAVAKGPLPADVTEACDAVGAGLRGPMPAYNR